eukprot:5052519-Karenia_brevis.AAC.1
MRAAKDPRLTADKSAVEDIRRGTQLNEPAATPSGAPGPSDPGAGLVRPASDAADTNKESQSKRA